MKRLLRNSGVAELSLFRDILGKTPAQAMCIMVEKFVNRLAYDLELEEMMAYLSPCRDWKTLDENISAFLQERHATAYAGIEWRASDIKQNNPALARWREEVDFWDKMRSLIQALPKPRDYRRPSARSALKMQPLRAGQYWHFDDCMFCWRTVPIHPDSLPTKPLCFMHRLEPTSSQYRKHQRLADQVEVNAFDLLDVLRAEYPDSLRKDEAACRQVNLLHLISPDSPLIHLSTYVRDLLGNNTEPEAVLHAFHGPFPKGLEPLYMQAMEEYISHCLQPYNFLATMWQLALAESWLKALNTDRRRKN